ncbi:MAG: DNA polymerase III subunit beta, partial [Rhodospirillales bacterium]|nr:DNA polymerase III subunit beta [Rhodospirillales bacterium]
EVELEVQPDNQRLLITAGRSHFELPTLPASDFQTMSSDDGATSFSLDAKDLARLIDKTRFAISTEETRYYLNGIYLHAAEDGGVNVLRAVATDGHRLASVQVPLPSGAEGMPGVIVPRKTVSELRKLIDEEAGDIAISLSETKIRFAFGGAVLTSKLIDGTFPDYQRVIPEGNDKNLEVPRKQIQDAVDRVSAISTEKSRAVKMALSSGGLVLSASSAENGTAIEELEVPYEGGDLEIGFNSRYLLDIIQQMEGDTARFTMADGASPTIVRDTSDASALYVLMPMRV